MGIWPDWDPRHVAAVAARRRDQHDRRACRRFERSQRQTESCLGARLWVMKLDGDVDAVVSDTKAAWTCREADQWRVATAMRGQPPEDTQARTRLGRRDCYHGHS